MRSNEKGDRAAGNHLHWFRRYVWLPSKWVFTPVALICIGYVAYLARQDIVSLWQSSNKTLLIATTICLAVVHGLLPRASVAILRSLNQDADYRTLLHIHLKRLPARYLPGGIWHTVGRAVDMRALGIPSATVAGFVVLENCLSVTTAFAFGGFLLVCSGSLPWQRLSLIAAASILAFIILLATPYLMNRLMPSSANGIKWSNWVNCGVWFILIWFAQAIAFTSYSIALATDPVTIKIVHVAGVYLFSWAIGFVAFFAPQGIGVFEASAAFLLNQPMLPTVIATIAGFRLCMLVVDLVFGTLVNLLPGEAR